MGDTPPFTGLLSAMVTPFDPDGRVNEDIAVSLGRQLLAIGRRVGARPRGICVSCPLLRRGRRDAAAFRRARALRGERGLAQLYRVLFHHNQPGPSRNAALKLPGLDVGDPRLPLVPADETELAQIETLLERYDLLGHR